MARSLKKHPQAKARRKTEPDAEPRQTPKILLIHGVGEPVERENWSRQWVEKLVPKFKTYYPKLYEGGREVEFAEASYHDLFEADFREDNLDPEELIRALATLGWSKMQHGFGGLLRGTRGLSAVVEMLRWTAGMVVRWTTDPGLRGKLRERIQAAIDEHNPTIIAAHSLGSLIAYDLFRQEPEAVAGRTFISFGSQIGNAFVRNVFNGRLCGLPQARYWLHLFNPNDAVFTAEIRLHGDDTLHASEREEQEAEDSPKRRNFYQIQTPFDNKDPLDHTAVSTAEGTVGYLDTFEALQLVWPRAFKYSKRHDEIRRTIRRANHLATETPDHRALLIGIDQYLRTDIPPLAGCTNDTYLISQVLQEEGFPVESIRMLHNDRATGAAIRDRLDWLLDDVDPGEFRVLFFSGHGHQLESYGPNEAADRLDECLCPYDYDYSVASGILDDHLYNLYAQLPYNSQLVVILDCCHSGGMARSGTSRVRGLTSPMDVAHRGLFWNYDKATGNGLWARRSKGSKNLIKRDSQSEFTAAKAEFKVNAHLPSTAQDDKSAYCGNEGTLRRLFRGLSLRQKLKTTRSDPTASAQFGAPGPFLPVILQACAEDDVALEHTDGMVTHGAFTFCLARVFRDLRPLDPTDPRIRTWSRLIEETTSHLASLDYSQQPQILVPQDQDRIAFHPPPRSGSKPA